MEEKLLEYHIFKDLGNNDDFSQVMEEQNGTYNLSLKKKVNLHFFGAKMIYVYLLVSPMSFWVYCSHRLNWIQFIPPSIWEIHLESHLRHAESMKIHF